MKKYSLLSYLCLIASSLQADSLSSNLLIADINTLADHTLNPINNHDINPSASPQVTHGARFFMTADFIYWNAKQEGISFAADGRSIVTNNLPPPKFSKGSIKDITPNYQPGFKIGAGLNFAYDGWDVYTNYTWLNPASHHESAKRNLSHGDLRTDSAVPLPATSSNLLFPLLSAKSKWKLHFNVLDIELGRQFYISSKLTTRPFIGLKAAWITQHQHIYYLVDTSELSIDLNPPSDVFIRADQDFTGFGLRTGMNTNWRVAPCWSIFGNLAFSLLWSEFTHSRHDTQTAGSFKPPLFVVSTYDSLNFEGQFHALRPTLEMALGLAFSHDFNQGKSRLTLSAGWEGQIWLNHNQFIQTLNSSEGDLTLYGLTAKAGYSF